MARMKLYLRFRTLKFCFSCPMRRPKCNQWMLASLHLWKMRYRKRQMTRALDFISSDEKHLKSGPADSHAVGERYLEWDGSSSPLKLLDAHWYYWPHCESVWGRKGDFYFCTGARAPWTVFSNGRTSSTPTAHQNNSGGYWWIPSAEYCQHYKSFPRGGGEGEDEADDDAEPLPSPKEQLRHLAYAPRILDSHDKCPPEVRRVLTAALREISRRHKKSFRQTHSTDLFA